MDYSGPASYVFAVALLFLGLVGLTTAAFAVVLGERARKRGDAALVHARFRRACWCFLLWGAFVFLLALIGIVDDRYLQVVVLPGAIPATLVALLGVFHALMLWRVQRIRLLLLPTVALLLGVAVLECGRISEAPYARIQRLMPAIAIVYGAFVVGVSTRGLKSSRPAPPPVPS